MADPYLGEIIALAFSWYPANYALCNGQMLPPQQNAALFSLLGSTFGGNGTSTFALPNLQGRAPIHPDLQSGIPQGLFGGEENVTLSQTQMPAHTHRFMASAAEADGLSMDSDANDTLAQASGSAKGDPALPAYGPAISLATLAPGTSTSTGGGAAHFNVQPCLALNFCIALEGYYPPRN